MLNVIREKLAKYFIIAMLVAFVGLIFFGWGMEAYQARQMDINAGKIDGQPVEFSRFVNVFERALENETAQLGGNRSFMVRRTVLERVWDEFISQHIYDGFFEKNNVTVSSAEILEFMKMNPPPEIVNSPVFQTEGVFDTAKYHELFLNNPEAMRQNLAFVQHMEHAYREHLLRHKLRLIINAVPSMSKLEKEAYVRDNTVMGRFEYISIPLQNIPAESISITDQMLQREYDARIEEFKVGERANLKYLRVMKSPSARDTAMVLRDVSEVRERFNAGEDFLTLAKDYSEADSQDSIPGDLGYMRVDQMPPDVLAAVENLEKGQISELVKSPRGFFIYKLISTKTEKDPFEEKDVEFFRLGEIFFGVSMGVETEDSLRAHLEDIRERIVGKTDSIQGFDFVETEKFELASFMVPGVGFVDRVSSFAHNAEKGEFSDVLENDNSFFLFYLKDKTPAGHLSLDDVRDRLSRELEAELRRDAAANYMKQFYAKIEKGIPFDSIPKIDNLVTHNTTEGFLTKYDFFPGAGSNNEFHAVSFRLQPGEMIKRPVVNSQGAHIVRMLEMTHRDSTQIQMYESQVRTIFQRDRNNFFDEWSRTMREAIEIEDNRYRFF